MALETELRYFGSVKDDLLRHHDGKFALIIGSELLGVYDTAEQAYIAGIESRGNVPMLIKHVLLEEPIATIPVLTVGLPHAVP